ncbi:MAG: UDP-N-acetylmuramate dehydrogenase [Eubacterium sp.]|nr:UDP-N-acetylmuramate dehydrogenase [Eubacterium sp.]
MEYRADEPMKLHTTFRTGGPARRYCSIASIDELKEVMSTAEADGDPLFIIGNGSNLLVSDRGIDGTVIEVGDRFRKIRVISGDSEAEIAGIYAEAGALLSVIAVAARDAGLDGMVFASGIPGTLGGAVSMNAGAYGGEMKDIIEYVDVFRNGKEERIPGADMHFGYRTSICHEEPMVVLGAKLRLIPGKKEEIAAAMQDLSQRRREKQPLEYPSAGSTFKRPEGFFAGKLIQDSGLSGYRIGGAEVSAKHCGFVINRGDATSDDIYQLIRHIIRTVEEKHQVRLEPEVRMLGEFE